MNDRFRACAFGRGAGDLDEEPLGVAHDVQDRVDHEVDGRAMAVQLHDQRVHQEGHIVGDHLDDRVGGLPAVLLEGRVVDPQLELGGPPLPQQTEVRECGAVEVRDLALTQVLGRDAGIVPADEGLDPPRLAVGRRSRASVATASMTSSFFCSGERAVRVIPYATELVRDDFNKLNSAGPSRARLARHDVLVIGEGRGRALAAAIARQRTGLRRCQAISH